MVNPRLATRYAKSILDLSIERGELETVYKDMLTLLQISKGNRDFVAVLRSPVISSDKKIKIVEAVTNGKISELTASFNRLLINKAREAGLEEIADAFVKQYKQYKNIHTVKLTTAAPISDALKNDIINQVRNTSDMQNIELETYVDESLIGGFTLQAGDKLVDGSISYELKQISKQFDNNDFVFKVV